MTSTICLPVSPLIFLRCWAAISVGTGVSVGWYGMPSKFFLFLAGDSTSWSIAPQLKEITAVMAHAPAKEAYPAKYSALMM